MRKKTVYLPRSRPKRGSNASRSKQNARTEGQEEESIDETEVSLEEETAVDLPRN